MGIYSSNRMSGIGYNMVDYTSMVEADQSYNDITGCAMACLEAQQNDLALFNATITNDFTEVRYFQEGYSVLNESASGILGKIKEIFLKLLAKIKGIFKAFLAKLSGVFRSNKGLYDQYKDTISKYHSWKGFKVKKYRNMKDAGSDPTKKISNAVEYNVETMIYSTTKYNDDTTEGHEKISTFMTASENDTLDNEDIAEFLIDSRLVNKTFAGKLNSDLSNVTEELMDYVYDDEETKDDWNGSDILNGIIGRVLYQGEKIETEVKKENTNLERCINKIINELNREQSKITKAISDKSGSYQGVKLNISNTEKYKGTLTRTDEKYTINKLNDGYIKKNGKYYHKKGDDIDPDNNTEVESTEALSSEEKTSYTDKAALEGISKAVSVLQRIASEEQTFITKLTTARLTATKFLISQARRVWSSAAAFASTEHKNEGYEFYSAFGEASVYEFMTDMESIC